MTDLSGAISLDDGPATIAAEHAQYDMDSETVTVPGTVLVKGADGYSIDAQGVAVNLKTRSLSGDGGVEGTLNIGRFSANELYAALDQRTVRLSGHARLRLHQGVFRCIARPPFSAARRPRPRVPALRPPAPPSPPHPATPR